MVETYEGHLAQILAFFAYTLLSIKAGEIALQEVNLHDARIVIRMASIWVKETWGMCSPFQEANICLVIPVIFLKRLTE